MSEREVRTDRDSLGGRATRCLAHKLSVPPSTSSSAGSDLHARFWRRWQ